MPSTTEKKDKLYRLLIEALRNLDPAEAIDESDPRYVNCAQVRGEEGIVVTKIHQAILRASEAGSKPRTILFSGHNGSGKSTELKSLERELTRRKLFTVKIDAQDALDLEDPYYIDILFSIAAEIERRMRENGMHLPQPLMDSIKNWFKEIEIEKTTDADVSADIEAGVEAGAKIPLLGKLFTRAKGKLKYSSTERKTIRQKIEPACSQLMGFINAMVTEAEKALKTRGYLGMVIIYDNLGKMKLAYPGNSETGDGRSTHETIFIDNSHHLAGILCHKIYTVPLSLLYSIHHARLGQLYDAPYVLPMIKVSQTRSRERDEKGIAALVQVAGKRLDKDRIFGNDDLIQEIASFSGGNVRDFIRILRSLVEQVQPEDLPLQKKDIEFTFRRITREYETAPSDEEFELLARVYESFAISNDRAHFRLLNNHFILAYDNGATWYDVHPALQRVAKFKAVLENMTSQEK